MIPRKGWPWMTHEQKPVKCTVGRLGPQWDKLEKLSTENPVHRLGKQVNLLLTCQLEGSVSLLPAGYRARPVGNE